MTMPCYWIALAGWLLLGGGGLCPGAQAQGNGSGPKIAGNQYIAREDGPKTGAGQQDITRKLNAIIIPQIEFHATTIEDAVEFLRQESRRLDPDPNPASRGINILLNLPTASAVKSDGSASVFNSHAGTQASPTANTRITLTLTRIPLLEALKYVAGQAGLKVKVEPYAVTLVPLTASTDPLVTAVFSVPPNFISNVTNKAGTSALDQPATAAH